MELKNNEAFKMIMIGLHKTLPISILLLLFTFPVIADSVPEELGIYEKLDHYIPDNIQLTDENYNVINLKDAIDKPTVIALVYYECPGLCSPLLEGVADVITKAKIDLGTEYQVFTISFDPDEKPKLARDKKTTYSKLVKGKDVDNGWTWFTGDSANINTLLNSLGYKVKKQGEEFIHPGALIVISPEGKITRYLHGVYFLPFDLKMAVVEASEERSGPTINKVLQYCFSYDPEGQKYVFNITKISGTLILLFALALFGGLMFKRKNKTNHSIKENK
ncbi:MAG: SCO family protein [Bacteroidales bacterium]|nr:SCO family protein [Bacteroidales bacterium]MCF8402434.1 SCO family protein [Bacteroidales bacterium]